MSKATIGAGSKLQLGDGASPEAFAAVAEILTLKRSGKSIKTADVTNMDSPTDSNGVVHEEFVGTIMSGGDFDFTYNFIPDVTGGQAAMRAAFDGKIHNYKLVTPKDNTANSPVTKWTLTFSGLIVTADDLDFSIDKQIVGTGKIKISGVDSWA